MKKGSRRDATQNEIDEAQNLIKVTSPEAAYVLGFLWADGHLKEIGNYRISLEILRSDAIEIQEVFQDTGQWYTSDRSRPQRQPQRNIYLTNKIVHSFLVEQGYLERHLGPKILTAIACDLEHYWWRGYFDGDGCFYTNKRWSTYQVTLSSCFNQNWMFMHSLCSELGIQGRESKQAGTRGSSSRFRITDKKGVMKFLEYIYSGKQFGLSRKHTMFINASIPDHHSYEPDKLKPPIVWEL